MPSIRQSESTRRSVISAWLLEVDDDQECNKPSGRNAALSTARILHSYVSAYLNGRREFHFALSAVFASREVPRAKHPDGQRMRDIARIGQCLRNEAARALRDSTTDLRGRNRASMSRGDERWSRLASFRRGRVLRGRLGALERPLSRMTRGAQGQRCAYRGGLNPLRFVDGFQDVIARNAMREWIA
jgi:hypothetical protein